MRQKSKFESLPNDEQKSLISKVRIANDMGLHFAENRKYLCPQHDMREQIVIMSDSKLFDIVRRVANEQLQWKLQMTEAEIKHLVETHPRPRTLLESSEKKDSEADWSPSRETLDREAEQPEEIELDQEDPLLI